jgi:hypothetical protein
MNSFCVPIHIHIEREKEKRVNPVCRCILLGRRLCVVPSHIHFFLCEFSTAQLNTIDGDVFDIELYIGENEKKDEIDS